MPSLTLEQTVQIVTALVTLVGAYFVLKGQVGALKSDVALLRSESKADRDELLRQLTAFHRRLDHQNERLSDVEKAQVRLETIQEERMPRVDKR